MKKTIIFSLFVGASALCAVSCIEIDNFDAPDSRISGQVIDATTNKPILASQGHGHIRLWEVSYSKSPAEIEIPLKQDGTYNNNKFFSADYDIVPIGPWWPADTLRKVKLNKNLVKDFTVTPYLTLSDLKYEVRFDEAEERSVPGVDGKVSYEAGMYLYMSCKIDAPVKDKLPILMEVRPYVSRTIWCGPGVDGSMGYYGNARYMRPFNAGANNAADNWQKFLNENERIMGLDEYKYLDSGDKQVVKLPKMEVKSGYTYTIRMGAKVRDTHQNFNLTEIATITIP